MHSPRLLLALSLGVSWAMTGPGNAGNRRPGRWLVALLAVGVFLDLLVGLALGYVAVQAREAASQAHIARVAGYEACQLSNQDKAADATRWAAVLALLDSGPQAAQLGQFVAGVEAANRLADSPRNCTKLLP